MILKVKNKKGDYEELEIEFISFWGNWVLAYLATTGVIAGVALILGLLMGALS